jgi:hypothetical protein
MSMAGYAQSYEESTAIFAAALALVNPENIDKADHAGWSPRQIIHHMADSESQSNARLRRILAEPGTQILGYDENAWSECSELGYRTLPIENSLALALAARNSSLEILQNLRTTDLAKFAIHSETGNFTLKNWLEVYTKHPVDHANQLREVIAEQKKS